MSYIKKDIKLLFLILLAIPLIFLATACGENDSDVLQHFKGITFNNITCDYDGNEHTIVLNGNLPENAVVEYSNNTATNAGVYTATAIISLEGYKTLTLKANLTINKLNYDMSNTYWNYNNQTNYIYDGTLKTVEIVGLPQGVTVKSYSNNSSINAGDFTASAILNYDTINHNAPKFSTTLNWKINKATFDTSNTHWDYTNPFTYDGSQKTVALVNLPQGITVASYTNNTSTNAGNFTATAVLNYDTVNYNTPNINTALNWKINKATYDMSNVVWNYTSPFVYDGTLKTVLVVGLPQGVTISSYTNNSKTDAGTYVASAVLNYDTANYNEITIEDCTWKIIPDLSNLASSIVSNLIRVPDPWEFLPESFSLENKAYAGNTEIDFTSFVNVSTLPKVAMGKQMNVVYSTLLDVEKALSYLKYIYGSANVITNFYQTFINSNPDNYTSYEKQTDNFTFKIVLDNADYNIYVSYKSVAIELKYEIENQKCYGRIQLTDSTVLKYEMSDNYLKVAVNILNVALTQLEFIRENDNVVGYLYEFYGTESKNIKTSALIKVDANYTTIISNKRETDDLIIEGYMEIYKNSTGNLVGAEVRETVKNIKYETSWFNLYDVANINTIKVLDDVNGVNADTIFINGSSTAIKTKLVGGFSLKATSRRFDIEMKDMFIYTYNQNDEKYEKVKIQLPMLFVQNEFINSFSTDFYEKNSSTGAINPTTISLSNTDKSYMLAKYNTLIDAYLVIKNEVTYQYIKDYIGTKNTYFN